MSRVRARASARERTTRGQPRPASALRIGRLLLAHTAVPLLLLLAVFVLGTVGYLVLGYLYDRPWSILDCAFMTSITLSTVGYGDVLDASAFPAGRIYTMLLVVTGLGATLYSVSTLTAFIVEGHLRRLFEEFRMESRIDRLEGHTIICGSGRTGRTVAEEHWDEDRPFVLIDRDPARLAPLIATRPDLLSMVGDATAQELLDRAGLSRAAALVAALGDDKANMFLVVVARYARKDLRIVVKCLDHDAAAKFIAAGATHVVSPAHIGGRRIASHVLRPGVLDFIDSITRRSEAGVGAAEIAVEPGSALEGRTLDHAAQLAPRLPIVALRRVGEHHFVYAPEPNEPLTAGTTLVVIGPDERVRGLAARARR